MPPRTSARFYLFTFSDSTFGAGTLEGIIGSGYTGPKDFDASSFLDDGDKFSRGLSLDGARLAVAADGDDGPFNSTANAGAVYLFTFSDNNFNDANLVGTLGSGYADVSGVLGIDLSPRLEAGDRIGGAVSLDGNRLAVGASFDAGAGNIGVNRGAAHLFTFTDADFNGALLEATIGSGYTGGKNFDLSALEDGDRFATSLSLDGSRLAVGADRDDGAGNAASDSGAVYLFSFADDSFSNPILEATVGKGYTGGKNVDVVNLEGGSPGDLFSDVSLDGNRLAVGARVDDGFGNITDGAGAVYLFSFTDSTFGGGNLEGIIGDGYTGGKNFDLSQLQVFDEFGVDVSLDGNRLAVGSFLDDGAGLGPNFDDTGAVYLFSFADSTFSSPVLEATIGDGYAGGKNLDVTQLQANPGDQLGVGVALDGNRLVATTNRDDGFGDSLTDSGTAYLFTFSDSLFSGGALQGIIGSGYSGAKDVDLTGLGTDDQRSRVSMDGNRLALGAGTVYLKGLST